jgi:hypothetical protein
MHAHYRRDMNLLSSADYRPYRAGYSRIRVQPIVGFATGKYDALSRAENNR